MSSSVASLVILILLVGTEAAGYSTNVDGIFCMNHTFSGHSKSVELRLRWHMIEPKRGQKIEVTMTDISGRVLYQEGGDNHDDWSGRLREDGPHMLCFINSGPAVDVFWSHVIDSKGWRLLTHAAEASVALSESGASETLSIVKDQSFAYLRYDLSWLTEEQVQEFLKQDIRAVLVMNVVSVEERNTPIFVHWFPTGGDGDDGDINYFTFEWTASTLTWENRPSRQTLVTRQRAREGQRIEARFTRQIKELFNKPRGERQVSICISSSRAGEVVLAGVDAEIESLRPAMVLETDQSHLELQFDKFARTTFGLNSNMNFARYTERDIRDTTESSHTSVLWYKIAGFVGIVLVSVAQIFYTRSLFDSRYSN